jgi:hypothetical protein
LLRWIAPLAAVPGVLAATVLALAVPSASRLRTIGWTLVGATILGALIMIAGER